MNHATYCSRATDWNRAPVWDSTFKIAEAPIRYFYNLHHKYQKEEVKIINTSFKHDMKELWTGLKNRNLRVIKNSLLFLQSDIKNSFIRLYQVKHWFVIVPGIAMTFPLTLALTPISILADIFAGVIQASLRLSQGAAKDEILSILHKKVIVSPLQQGIFFLISTVVLSIFTEMMLLRMGILLPSLPMLATCTLCMSACITPLLYPNSQLYIANLPRFFRPEGYNIFIAGAVDIDGNGIDFDAEVTYSEWRRSFKQNHSSSLPDPFTSGSYRSSPTTEARRAFGPVRTTTQKGLDQLSIRSKEGFKEIRTWFEKKEDTFTLFGFSSADEVTLEKLQRSYRFLTLKCHPDRRPDTEKKEAEIWFNLLNEARVNIETNILGLKN